MYISQIRISDMYISHIRFNDICNCINDIINSVNDISNSVTDMTKKNSKTAFHTDAFFYISRISCVLSMKVQ
jgi:hypothetical protein